MKVCLFVLLLIVSSVGQTKEFSQKNVVECEVGSGANNYRARVYIDFSNPTVDYAKDSYCADSGRCYNDTCDCGSVVYYDVKKIQWPAKIVVTGQLGTLEKESVAIASGSENANQPLEYTQLRIYDRIQSPHKNEAIFLTIAGSLRLSNHKFKPYTYVDREDLYVSTNWLDIEDEPRSYLRCHGLN